MRVSAGDGGFGVHRDVIGDHEGGVKADTELTNDVSLGGALQGRENMQHLNPQCMVQLLESMVGSVNSGTRYPTNRAECRHAVPHTMIYRARTIIAREVRERSDTKDGKPNHAVQ